MTTPQKLEIMPARWGYVTDYLGDDCFSHIVGSSELEWQPILVDPVDALWVTATLCISILEILVRAVSADNSEPQCYGSV